MVTETQIEYETIERERTVTRCDHCDRASSALDDAVLFPMLVGPTLAEDTRHRMQQVNHAVSVRSLPGYIDHFGTVDVCTECFEELYEQDLEWRTMLEADVNSSMDRRKLERADDIADVEFPDWTQSSIPSRPTIKLSETETEIETRFGNRSVLGIGLIVGACLGAAVMVSAGNVATGSVLYPVALLVLGLITGLLFDLIRNYG